MYEELGAGVCGVETTPFTPSYSLTDGGYWTPTAATTKYPSHQEGCLNFRKNIVNNIGQVSNGHIFMAMNPFGCICT